MRLGLLGGTFNPIHLGHLILAESAREAFKLDQVLFIPTSKPPHKGSKDLLTGSIRLSLIKSAIKGSSAFKVSSIELKRSGPSYTIDTLKILKREHPTAKLFLIIGSDLLSVRWKSWDEIKRICRVVVVSRAGSRLKLQNRLRKLSMPQIDISASAIRHRVRSRKSIKYLVPPSVEKIIKGKRLYRRSRA